MKIRSFWLSWFVNGIGTNAISVIVITCLLTTKPWSVQYPAIEQCNPFFLGLFLILYCGASITMLFAFSTMFNKRTFHNLFPVVLDNLFDFQRPSLVSVEFYFG